MQGQYQILFALPLQLCHHGMCQYFFVAVQLTFKTSAASFMELAG